MRTVVLLIVYLTNMAASQRQRDPGAPMPLRIRRPPMLSDPIKPECYNFTIGNWRRQEFYSPNFPEEYLGNLNCVLYLEAPPGFRIQLDFRDHFTLEKSEDCKYDFLEVRDGPFAYSPLIDRFCSAMFPPLIESTDRFLWLRFKTDDLLQYQGFRAIYSYHKDNTQDDGTSLSKVASTVCRIPIKLSPNNPDGLLSSREVPFGDVSDPNYPRNLPVDCTWEIFTEQGNLINLRALKVSRGGSARCDDSYVALYQGTTLDTDQRSKLCGKEAPSAMSLTSTANRVFVRLFGNVLRSKPDLQMVYSLVHTGDACQEGALSCGQFCVAPDMRCNGVPNCPDGRDEQGCPPGTRNKLRNRGRRPGVGDVGGDYDGGGDVGGGDTGGRGGAEGDAGGNSGFDGDGDDSGEATETKIPMHMIILGAIGGVLLTGVLLCLCIMCRSRRQQARKKKKEGELKSRQQGKQTDLEMAGTPLTQTHPTHSLSRPGDRDGGGNSGGVGGGGRTALPMGQGQGHPQGRYMTFAQMTALPKDNSHRHSFTGPQAVDGGEFGDLSDSGQYRRYMPMEVTPDHLEDGSPSGPPSLFSGQGSGVMGLTHLPSPTSPSLSVPQSPVDGSNYSKYQSQWGRGVMEDPSLMYPYTSSLPRPTPFLGLSKPFQAESKYLKSMQALKVMDEEIMKESPTS